MRIPSDDVLRELIALVDSENLDELTVVNEGVSIRVRGRAPQRARIAAVGASAQERPPTEAAPPAAPPANAVSIVSPLVGVFYRAPAPDAPPFVEEGSIVEIGDTVGLVEAMKVFNEITTEVRGRVLSIPAENESLVERGETLVVIERL